MTAKKVEIYTLDYCPFCRKAKIFLEEKGIKYNEILCDDNEEEKRKEITKKFNLKSLATFPQIIIDGQNIGGYSDMIEKVERGELVF